MNKPLKFAAVSAASALVGWGIGRVVIHAAGPQWRPRHAPSAERPSTYPSHSMLSLDRENRGEPGQLLVQATMKIGEPNRAERVSPNFPREEPNDIIAAVFDWDSGEVVIPWEKVGEFVDKLGVGYWERDYLVDFRLPPGKYRLIAIAHDPTKFRPGLAGDERQHFGFAVSGDVDGLYVVR